MWKTILSRPMRNTEGNEKELREKYGEILRKVKQLIDDQDVINAILEEYPKDLDTSKESYEINRKLRIIKLLSIAGYDSDEELKLYEDALRFSTAGYSIVLERDIDEIYVNSYNPEWARAWNGNTDLQVCFDYFAVITYITEYYCKDDTGMMTKILENSQAGT